MGLYTIIENKGKGKNKSITVTIRKQNSDEQFYTITLGGLENTKEAYEILNKGLELFQDRITKTAVFNMLSCIKELSTENQVRKLIDEFTRRLRGEE